MKNVKFKMMTVSHNTALLFANRVSVPLILAISAWTLYSVIDLQKNTGTVVARAESNGKAIEAQENRINNIEAYLFGQHANNGFIHR